MNVMANIALQTPFREMIDRRRMAKHCRTLLDELPGSLEQWRKSCLDTRRAALVREFDERLDAIPADDLRASGALVLTAMAQLLEQWHRGRDGCAREAIVHLGQSLVVVTEQAGLSADLGKVIGSIFDDATEALQADIAVVLSARFPLPYQARR